MNRFWYAVLFVLCVATGVISKLYIPQYTHSVLVEHSTAKTPLIIYVSALISFVAFIWGLILTFKKKQWKWFVSFIVLNYITIGCYALWNLINSKKISKIHEERKAV
jgi:hypothetical protein